MPNTFATITDPWPYWFQGTTGSTTLSIDLVWVNWTTASATTIQLTSAATTTNGVWAIWNTATTLQIAAPTPIQVAVSPEVRAQREQARREEEERWRREHAEQQRFHQVAEARARAILLEHLDAAQRAEFEQSESFHVTSRSGRRYQVRKGIAGNVLEVREDGLAVARYCIHPAEQVPAQDNMLAQKFLLETDEAHFLATANKTTLVDRHGRRIA